MNPWNLLLNVLGGTLTFFYSIIPDYGVAIILLTLVVSLLLFPLTLKQTRSMRAMQEIQPEVKRLQKELKGDREELNKQLMALYQEKGVNPAAGCLPLLLQMPIWFALLSVLRIKANPDVPGTLTGDAIPVDSALGQALLSGHTDFLGMDLQISPSQAFSQLGFPEVIPYLILLAIVIAAGYYQQVQATRRRTDQPQSQQAQSMQSAMKFMPVFFGVISWTFPTGLVLYFATSNLFRIAQQAFIIWLDERHEAQGGAGKAASGSGSGKPGPGGNGGVGGEGGDPQPPKRTGPAPNRSKKRNKRRRK